MAQDLLQRLLIAVLICAVCAVPSDKKDAVNTYDVEYGVYLGQLAASANSLVSGRAYLVNESTIQIIDFSYTGKPNDAFFYLSRSDSPTGKDVVKVPTFMFGYTPLDTVENVKRVVLNLPGVSKINEFKGLYVYSPNEKTNYGSVSIPDDVIVPKTHFLPKELNGKRYSVRSGPILILDTRTIKIFAFNFDGDKAPDGYFFVGRGLHVSHDVGVKVAIRGKDKPDSITPMSIKYRGGKDIILDLPENYDVYHVDFLSVYCYKFHVDFANVLINSLPPNLPPYVPVQQKYDLPTKAECNSNTPWKAQALLGTEARTNFTLQLGPPGGNCGYKAITGIRPAEYVWYVNGYIAEIYLKRGLNYTFQIEGGQNNSFYISEEPFGGYSKLEADEQKQVTVFAPKDKLADNYSERLCIWEGSDSEQADRFGTFEEFRHNLQLDCANHGDGEQKVLRFNPDNSTPPVIYGNGYDTYGMGFKIHVVDEFPADIQDIHEQPFTVEAWVHNVNAASSSVLVSSAFFVCSILVLNALF